MEEVIKQEKGWSIFVLIILVLLFCGFGVMKAFEQRGTRLNWQNSVDMKLVSNDKELKGIANSLDTVATAYNTLDENFNNLQQFCQQQTTTVHQNYQKLAGCYGVIPTNETTFSLQCRTDFK